MDKMRLLLFMFVLAFAFPANASVRRALIFGLGMQKDTRWGKIHGDNDVYYVERMLRSAGYQDIVSLKNESATKRAMVKAFVDLANRCGSGDLIYIHYSGHGQLMTDLDGDEATRWRGEHAKWDEAWIPYDAYMTYGSGDRGEKHLSDDEIAGLLTAIRRKIGQKGQITVVVDACHSGDATCGGNDECVRGVDMKFNIPKIPGSGQMTAIAEQWRTISACKPYQLCTEIKEKRVGKLTYALFCLGKEVLGMSNKQLESKLAEEMGKYKGRLMQNPVVSGKK